LNTIAFAITDLEQAQGAGTVRELVAEHLRPDYSAYGKLYEQLVDEVLAVLNKILTTNSSTEPPSAAKPQASRTMFQARPRWATRLGVSFNPPQKASVTGPVNWLYDAS
jgi:hypothetical protein